MAFEVLFVIVIVYNSNIDKMNIEWTVLYSFINYFIYIKISKVLEIKTCKNIIYKLLKVCNSFQVFGTKDFLQFFKQLNFKSNYIITNISIIEVRLNTSIKYIFAHDIKIIVIKKVDLLKKLKGD